MTSGKSRRSLLPKGQHYTDLIPLYVSMLNSGKSIKQIALETNTPAMTVRSRLFMAGIKTKTLDNPFYQIAALSYLHSTEYIYATFANISPRMLSHWRHCLKRKINLKRLRYQRPRVTDKELGELFNPALAEKTFAFIAKVERTERAPRTTKAKLTKQE